MTPSPSSKGIHPTMTSLPSGKLFPLLMVIPYNQLNRVHSLTAILTKAVKYKANHGAKFICPACLPLYNKTIPDNATTVIHVRGGAAHKSQLDDYASYKAAKRGVSKFLHNIVNEIWYNDLKNANTFYTKVTAIDIMSLLGANSGGLHALNMNLLCTDTMQYYVQADGIPQFIVMMEDAQKKAKRAGMPIADVELVKMALALSFRPSTSHMRSSIGKASRPGLVRGKPGRWLSALPTSNASTNTKLWGEANPVAMPTQ
jgi:hypothetical protein